MDSLCSNLSYTCFAFQAHTRESLICLLPLEVQTARSAQVPLHWRVSKTNFNCSLCTILKHKPLKWEAGIEKLGKYHSFLKKNKRLRTENPTTMLNANKIILIFLSFGVSWESLTIQVRLAYDWETKIKLLVRKQLTLLWSRLRWNTEDRLHSWAATKLLFNTHSPCPASWGPQQSQMDVQCHCNLFVSNTFATRL